MTNELLSHRLCEIGHVIKNTNTFLMYPSEKLDSPETFFVETFAKLGQTLEVVIEKIGLHIAI
jgi:hypothetical protein